MSVARAVCPANKTAVANAAMAVRRASEVKAVEVNVGVGGVRVSIVAELNVSPASPQRNLLRPRVELPTEPD
jgi:hypothetical protein